MLVLVYDKIEDIKDLVGQTVNGVNGEDRRIVFKRYGID